MDKFTQSTVTRTTDGFRVDLFDGDKPIGSHLCEAEAAAELVLQLQEAVRAPYVGGL